MSPYKFKLGADPEFFLTKGGVPVSAEGIIGGSKWEPILFDKRGFYMQEDNVMVEFNIPPAETKQQFVDYIEYAKEYLETLVRLKGNFECLYYPSAQFSKEELSSDQAKLFGCDPDFNIYTQMVNQAPSAASMTSRFAGGHIHIGFDYQSQAQIEDLVKALDMTIGVNSVLLDPDSFRKQFYGKAGNIRFKSYGVEYRSPSNFWIKDRVHTAWIYDKVEEAFSILDDIDQFYDLEEDVIDVVNNNKVNQAIELSELISERIKQTVKIN